MGRMLDKIRDKQRREQGQLGPIGPATRAQAKAPPLATPEQQDARRAHKGRLPDGSRFDLTYHANTQTWTGELLIWSVEVNDLITFSGEAPGVVRLLDKLDDLYRKWVTEHSEPEGPAVP